MTRFHIVITAPQEEIDPDTGEIRIIPGTQETVPYTPEEEAQADLDKAADDAAQAPVIAAAQRKAAFKADANYQTMLAQLKQATPAQVQTYITNNVTDLASARAMLIKIALVLALVANGS